MNTVPAMVMVLGWTPRRTNQFAIGSINRRYPFFSQSGKIFNASPGTADVACINTKAGATLRPVKVSAPETRSNRLRDLWNAPLDRFRHRHTRSRIAVRPVDGRGLEGSNGSDAHARHGNVLRGIGGNL